MIVDNLKSKRIEYMKAKDTLRLGVVRYLLSLIANKEIELRPSGEELTAEHVEKIIKREIKRRKEGMEVAEKAGRGDVVETEGAELGVLEELVILVDSA
jgi:uncharacterized protein